MFPHCIKTNLFLFVYTSTSTYRLAMRTSSVIVPIYCSAIRNNHTFPYRRDRMVIIVPNQASHTREPFRNAARLIIVFAWILSSIGFTLLRKFFKEFTKQTDFTVLGLFFNSFGLSLGTISKTRSNDMAESVLILTISLFSLLASLILSGYLFQQFSIKGSTSNIDTIAELKHTKIVVMIDNWFKNFTKDFFIG